MLGFVWGKHISNRLLAFRKSFYFLFDWGVRFFYELDLLRLPLVICVLNFPLISVVRRYEVLLGLARVSNCWIAAVFFCFEGWFAWLFINWLAFKYLSEVSEEIACTEVWLWFWFWSLLNFLFWLFLFLLWLFSSFLSFGCWGSGSCTSTCTDCTDFAQSILNQLTYWETIRLRCSFPWGCRWPSWLAHHQLAYQWFAGFC